MYFTFNHNWPRLDWKVGLEADIGANGLWYATVQTGFSNGAYQYYNTSGLLGAANSGPAPLVEPSKLVSYSTGTKFRFLDNRLEVNNEVYFYNYKDLLIAPFDDNPAHYGTAFYNADKTEIYGDELDVKFLVTADDQIHLNFNYNHARAINFIVGDPPVNYGGLQLIEAPDVVSDLGYRRTWHIPGGRERGFQHRHALRKRLLGDVQSRAHHPSARLHEKRQQSDLPLSGREVERRVVRQESGEPGGHRPGCLRGCRRNRRRILAAAAAYLRRPHGSQLVMASTGIKVTDDIPPARDWRFWCAYAVMIAPNAAVGLTLAAMPPILPELAARIGGDHPEQTAQLITSVSGFGMIVGGLFSGRLLEAVGIRTFTIGSLLMYGLFGTLGWELSGAASLGASRFMLGMGGVFFSTAALALTAATFSGEARSRVIGMQQATSQVVNVCAVFIVGALVQITGWRGAFLLYGAFAAVLLVMTLLGVHPRPAAPSITAAERPAERSVERLGEPASSGFIKTIAPVCALTTLMGILTVIPMAQLPFLLTDIHQGSAQQVSIVLGVNFIFAAISAINFAKLKTRFGKRSVFMMGLTVGMIGVAGMGYAPGVPAACLAAAFAGFGTGIYNTYVFDHGVEISPPVFHGRAAGLLFAFMFFGAAINPLVARVFSDFLGLHEAFPAMAIVALLCGLPVILRKPRAR